MKYPGWEKRRGIMDDRRSRLRYVLECLIEVMTPEGTMKGETKNVSVDGAFIICDEPLRPREQVTLAIEFPDGFLMDTEAEVVWSTASGPDNESKPQGMGVKFLW
jgi:hypothetical protein